MSPRFVASCVLALKLDTFVFLMKQKVYYTIPLFFDTLTAMCPGNKWYKVIYQAPVVQGLDNAIHQINHYPVDSVVCFVNTYPLDSDLSSG